METHRFILFQFILVNISISNTFLFAFYDCRAGCTRCAASHSVWTHAQIWTWTHSFLQTKWIFGWVYSANWAAEIKWARIYTIRCSHKDTHYYIVATHSFNETWNSVRWKKKKNAIRSPSRNVKWLFTIGWVARSRFQDRNGPQYIPAYERKTFRETPRGLPEPERGAVQIEKMFIGCYRVPYGNDYLSFCHYAAASICRCHNSLS